MINKKNLMALVEQNRLALKRNGLEPTKETALLFTLDALEKARPEIRSIEAEDMIKDELAILRRRKGKK